MEENINIDTLLTLIDDHDEEVYFAVRDKLIETGPAILPVLEYALSSSTNLLHYERLEQIIIQLKLTRLVDKTANWANSEDKTLLDGWILASTIHHPTIIPEKIDLLIQKIIRDIWIELNDSLTSLEKVSIVNHVFFQVYQFEINSSDIYAPENCLVNNLLVSRKGNLISLSTLYCIIAKKLNLPIHPIGVGQYIILGYYEPQISREVYGENADPYLFYINMEHKGAIIGAKELEYVVHENREKLEHTASLDDATVIKRLLVLLKQCYQINGNEEKRQIAAKLLDKLRRF
jgi:regulator of sirC expression with transglutaminase-like and TPR domain